MVEGLGVVAPCVPRNRLMRWEGCVLPGDFLHEKQLLLVQSTKLSPPSLTTGAMLHGKGFRILQAPWEGVQEKNGFTSLLVPPHVAPAFVSILPLQALLLLGVGLLLSLSFPKGELKEPHPSMPSYRSQCSWGSSVIL